MEDVTSTRIHLFVTLAARTHGQGRVHVDIVAGKVETDQALEDDGPSGERRRQKDQ